MFVSTIKNHIANNHLFSNTLLYEGHFRSNVNVIILVYSMLFTSKAVYHRKRQP